MSNYLEVTSVLSSLSTTNRQQDFLARTFQLQIVTMSTEKCSTCIQKYKFVLFLVLILSLWNGDGNKTLSILTSTSIRHQFVKYNGLTEDTWFYRRPSQFRNGYPNRVIPPTVYSIHVKREKLLPMGFMPTNVGNLYWVALWEEMYFCHAQTALSPIWIICQLQTLEANRAKLLGEPRSGHETLDEINVSQSVILLEKLNRSLYEITELLFHRKAKLI